MTSRLTFISDTHGRHYNKNLIIPEGDIIIHCGDVSKIGRQEEIEAFADWFGSLPYKHKIMTPGNHDFLFEKNYNIAKNIVESRGIICLIDEGKEIEGINFWGSPITPWFHSWAFNRYRGSSIEHHWNKIPDGIDILITHGPPAYQEHLSMVLEGEDVGCEDLYKAIKRVKPKINCFGHIHEGYGTLKDETTLYINCSILDRSYEVSNKPIQMEYRGGEFILLGRS